ncbi:2026_t:CDS:1, partial [Gigaspora rosea]
QQSNESNNTTPINSLFTPYIQRHEINQNLSNDLLSNHTPEFTFEQPLASSYQHLTTALKRLIHQFQTKILLDHPNILCAYCLMLMFSLA